MNIYQPLAISETLAEQRRPDPRILAAAGWPPPRSGARRRRQVGALLIRLGHRLQGTNRDIAPIPKPA